MPRLQLLLAAAALALAGCSGGTSSTPAPPSGGGSSTPPPPPTPHVSISASPATINSGQPSSLSWTSSNATSVSISPTVTTADQPGVPVNGSISVSPTQTTTYTITATGTGGTATATATVTVNQVPPALHFNANPTSIMSGQSTLLSWSAFGAQSLTIDNGIGSVDPTNGTLTVSPTATTTYHATATGANNLTSSAAVTVTVTGLNASLTANPTSIAPGGSATLTYSTSNAVSLTIDNGVGVVNPPSGTVTVHPTATTTYTITATDASHATLTAHATVTVNNGLQNLKHIIFILQENRSFDNYFSKLGVYRANDPFTGQSYGAVSDIDGIANDSSVQIKDFAGNPLSLHHAQTLCIDNTSPAWDESHFDVDKQPDGTYKMDGFANHTAASYSQQNDPAARRVTGYYDWRDLPYYYELATQFGTSDRWFSPMLANTVPNRMYMFAATSYGTTYPNVPTADAYKQKTIFEALDQAGITWGYYEVDQDTSFIAYYDYWTRSPSVYTHVHEIPDLFTLLADPNADQLLPQVVFIERGSGSSNSDEHPDSGKNVQIGAALVAQIINSLMASRAWPNSAFLWSMDEAGGMYDHVPPQHTTPPDNQPPSTVSPDNGATTVDPGDFATTGMRMPFILVSPYAKPHYVSHTVRDNTSILKLIEQRFGIPALTARDAAQPDMTEFFDFAHPAWLVPPRLPVQPVFPNSQACHEELEAQ